MDEEEFDALIGGREFTSQDAARTESQMARRTALGISLWGRRAEHLERQLTAPHPEIPEGYDLEDYRDLLRSTLEIAAAFEGPRAKELQRFRQHMPTLTIGARTYMAWEARCEIVRRAIEYLERG